MNALTGFFLWLRDTLLRLFPHATRPGLRAVGTPGPDSPVLLTGNFALTVRRVVRALAGRDAWLLVADSDGINVWCAAGGGHLTHHDVIAVVRSSRIAEKVAHRRLILPQLAATGVERRVVEARTGFRVVWGPARLEDLPAFLDCGQRTKKAWRLVRFPLWERLEMALMWAVPMALVYAAVLWLPTRGAVALLGAGVVALVVAAIFGVLRWLPVEGPKRWITYAGGAVLASALDAAAMLAPGGPSRADLVWLAAANLVAMLVLSVDLAGTTPWYPSTLNMAGNRFFLELDRARCTGAADCVQVCPRGVLEMDGRARKVTIASPEACVRCGACVVQCPADALHFRFEDGRLVPAEQVRRTRMNMLGRRSIEIG